MKDAHDGKQHKTYPKVDSISGNCFQSVVVTTGIIDCFHLVVRVHNLTQLQCGVGAEFGILSVDILILCKRDYRRINAHKPQIIQGSSVQFSLSSSCYSYSALTMHIVYM